MSIDQPGGSVHLAELRQILEPEIAARATAKIDEQQLAVMREAFNAMSQNMQNADGYIEADLDFHLALAEAARNPLILALLDLIVGQLREQRGRIFSVGGGPERGQRQHARILEAVEQHNPEAARTAMKDHLQQVLEDSAHSTKPSMPLRDVGEK